MRSTARAHSFDGVFGAVLQIELTPSGARSESEIDGKGEEDYGGDVKRCVSLEQEKHHGR
jgi:hypothetical protein